MSVQRLPNGRWKARIYTPDGRQLTKTFTRKIDARAWEDDQRRLIRQNEWVDPRAGDIRLGRWLDEVEASKLNLSPATKATRRYLRAHFADLEEWPIGKLTAEQLQRWVADKSQHLAPATVHKLAVILSEALRLAVARGKLARSPWIEIELPRVGQPEHRYLTEPEVWGLYEAMEPRYRPLILLGAYGGLRPGEAAAAQWTDLDGRNLLVRGTKTAKARRTVRLPQFVVDHLAEHRRQYPHVTLILHNRAGRPVDLNHLRQRQWRQAVDGSVGEPMRMHDLRHTHVALLIARGMHPKGISDRLGHSSIRTTMDTYGHLFEAAEADIIDGLGISQSATSFLK